MSKLPSTDELLTLPYAQRVKALRDARGETQERFAETLGTSRERVNAWERDRSRPGVTYAFKLSELANVPVELSTLGNVLWFVLAGWWLALGHLISGALLCLTVIGIPLGVASFKMAGAALAPFGKQIVAKSDLHYAPRAATP